LDTRQIQRRAGSIRAAIKPFRLLEKLCQSTRIKLPDKRLVTQEREIEMGFYSLLLGLARIRHRVPLASTPPGIPGTSPIFWLGGRQQEYPQYYYVLLDIANQYWLPSVRSASSRFHSAIRRHQFASIRQADSRLCHATAECHASFDFSGVKGRSHIGLRRALLRVF